MSTDTHGPRERAAQLTDAARALRTSLDAGLAEPFPVLADLIAAQSLLTQMYEDLAAWHHLEAGAAHPGDSAAATTASQLERGAKQSELVGVWLDSALRSSAASSRVDAA